MAIQLNDASDRAPPIARPEHERLRAALLRLVDAADEVGRNHFDTDDMPADAQAMLLATLAARECLWPTDSEGGDP